jgi:hypothetical protein
MPIGAVGVGAEPLIAGAFAEAGVTGVPVEDEPLIAEPPMPVPLLLAPAVPPITLAPVEAAPEPALEADVLVVDAGPLAGVTEADVADGVLRQPAMKVLYCDFGRF